MSQAITTRYHGPTNHRGTRVSARAQVGRRFYPWDYSRNPEENHRKAAELFATEWGWLTLEGRPPRTLAGGAMHDGTGYTFVIVEEG